jgi:DNA ligase-1
MSNSSLSLTHRRLIASASLAALTTPMPTPARAAAAPADALAPLLAGVYAGQVDPVPCLASEKYDGVRALWDGHVLRHRSGRVVGAMLPRVARRRALARTAELRRALGDRSPQGAGRSDSARVRYMVFEMPGGEGSFGERIDRLTAVVARAGVRQVELAPQRRVADRAGLARALDAVVAAGGEGLMLHLAAAPYLSGRSDVLLKLKPYLDAEAVVVGHQPGPRQAARPGGRAPGRANAGPTLLRRQRHERPAARDPPAIASVITTVIAT